MFGTLWEMQKCQFYCTWSYLERLQSQQPILIVDLSQGFTYTCIKLKYMYCFVSSLQTQARLSYYALLIWQSEQEAGGEHKYCLGWLLKTRDKPLIHGVLFLWKSPGGSCISSTLSKPRVCSALPSWGSAVCCNVCVIMAFFLCTHNWNCKLICLTCACWLWVG